MGNQERGAGKWPRIGRIRGQGFLNCKQNIRFICFKIRLNSSKNSPSNPSPNADPIESVSDINFGKDLSASKLS